MLRERFVQACQKPPEALDAKHSSSNFRINYICNMAVIHWALVALGRTHEEANKTVANFTKQTCGGCKSYLNYVPQGIITAIEKSGYLMDGGTLSPRHSTLSFEAYGSAFCKTASNPLSLDQLKQQVGIGDVVILGPKEAPTHSVVVVSKPGASVMVSGFNNNNSFNGVDLEYYNKFDPTLRSLDDLNDVAKSSDKSYVNIVSFIGSASLLDHRYG